MELILIAPKLCSGNGAIDPIKQRTFKQRKIPKTKMKRHPDLP